MKAAKTSSSRPTGTFAVWETRHQLWISSLATPGTQARQLTDIRGTLGSPAWSHRTASHLVATVNRGDHTLAAVLDINNGTLSAGALPCPLD